MRAGMMEKRRTPMPLRKRQSIPDDLLDALLAGTDAKTVLLETGVLLDSLKKASAEQALNPEMDHHLGDEADGNIRNPAYCWPTKAMTAMPCARTCSFMASCRSSRLGPIAPSQLHAISCTTRTATASSACSTGSSNSAASPPVTTKPPNPSSASCIGLPQSSRFQPLSTGEGFPQAPLRHPSFSMT